MLRPLLILILGAGLVAGGWLYWHFKRLSTWPLPISTPQALEVQAGDTALSLLLQAQNRGWLPGPGAIPLLRVFLSQQPEWAQIQAGHYAIYPGDSLHTLASRLRLGEVLQVHLTVVEGIRFQQLRAQLEAEPGLSNTTEGLDEAELMRRLGRDGLAAEGRFLPSSYRFDHGTTTLAVLRHLAEHLDQRLNEAWQGRDEGLLLKHPDELLVLASIIEKETGLSAERAEISGVFHRRLKKGMRLQTDPTVIYGLGDAFDGNLTRRHLRTDTPWNTYTRHGLPPTPIALAGVASLQAAAHPAEGDSYYFVANGQGGHVFSRTLEEHQRAVRRYQLGGR